MNPLFLSGLVQFNDSFARAARYGVGCTPGGPPCRISVPDEGRVITLYAGSQLLDLSFEGGTVTVFCESDDESGEDGVDGIELFRVSGDIHVTGCPLSVCEGVQGTLHADWIGTAHCESFSGTLVNPGDSGVTVTGAGTLLSGGSGTSTVIGGDWIISGSGSVDFARASQVLFEGGTAGITVLDWSWLNRPQLTLWEFANEAPRTDFVDQTIEVVGGWPEGSTVTECTVSGTLGYIPKIVDSSVYCAEHAYGPVVSVVEDSELNGNIRADGYVFLNNVAGDVTVTSHTTFVNQFSRDSELLIEGPHTVMCPSCGKVRVYNASMRTAETDVLFTSPPKHNLALNGHTAILGTFPVHRARRDDSGLSVIGDTRIDTASSTTIIGGTVTLVSDYTSNITQLIFSNVSFHFGSNTLTVKASSSIEFKNHSMIYAHPLTGYSTIALQDSSILSISESIVLGFLKVDAQGPSSSAGFMEVNSVSTQNAGGIGLSGQPLDGVSFCGLTWYSAPSLTTQYVYTYPTFKMPGENYGDAICFYSGTGTDVANAGDTCTSGAPLNGQPFAVDPGFDYCQSTTTTTTTITTTTVPTTTTTITTTTVPTTTVPTTTVPTTAPRPTQTSRSHSSSSSSDLDDPAEIAGIVVASLILLAMIVVVAYRFAGTKKKAAYEPVNGLS